MTEPVPRTKRVGETTSSPKQIFSSRRPSAGSTGDACRGSGLACWRRPRLFAATSPPRVSLRRAHRRRRGDGRFPIRRCLETGAAKPRRADRSRIPSSVEWPSETVLCVSLLPMPVTSVEDTYVSVPPRSLAGSRSRPSGSQCRPTTVRSSWTQNASERPVPSRSNPDLQAWNPGQDPSLLRPVRLPTPKTATGPCLEAPGSPQPVVMPGGSRVPTSARRSSSTRSLIKRRQKSRWARKALST